MRIKAQWSPFLAGFLSLLAFNVGAQEVYRWVDAKGRVHYSDTVPIKEAKKIEERKISENTLEGRDDYLVTKARQDYPVTLYTAQSCGEPCSFARGLLQKRGVPFAEKLVRTQADIVEYKKLFNGAENLPGFSVGKQVLVGFEESAWSSLLDHAGYPKSGTIGAQPSVQSTNGGSSAPKQEGIIAGSK